MKKRILRIAAAALVLSFSCNLSVPDQPAEQPPAAPDNFTVSDIQYNQISLTWSDNSNNEDNFILLKSLDSAFTSPDTFTLDSDLETYTDDSADPETQYFYRIHAENIAGPSNYTETDAVTPIDPGTLAPPAPSEVTLIDASDRAVLIKLTVTGDDEIHYIVQRSQDSGFSAYDEFILETDDIYFRDKSGVTPDTQYYYRVLAANTNGNSDPSDTINVLTDSAVSVPSGKRTADHTTVSMIKNGEIPVSAIENAKDQLVIAYGHTSHGSQLTSGMNDLDNFVNDGNCDGLNTYSTVNNLLRRTQNGADGSLQCTDGIMRADCGYYSTALSYAEYAASLVAGGDPAANWEFETRYFLGEPNAISGLGSKNPEYNVVIWSWCGQSGGRSYDAMYETYLNPMQTLENDYPGVIFVYMTGHLNGSGTYHTPNDYIRDFCETNNKWLFDFADIESFDPDGINYTVGSRTSSDGCVYDFNENGTINRSGDTNPVDGDRNWGFDWQADHSQYSSGSSDSDWYSCGAAHSAPINANLKAYAAWWLWCRLSGWDL